MGPLHNKDSRRKISRGTFFAIVFAMIAVPSRLWRRCGKSDIRDAAAHVESDRRRRHAHLSRPRRRLPIPTPWSSPWWTAEGIFSRSTANPPRQRSPPEISARRSTPMSLLFPSRAPAHFSATIRRRYPRGRFASSAEFISRRESPTRQTPRSTESKTQIGDARSRPILSPDNRFLPRARSAARRRAWVSQPAKRM